MLSILLGPDDFSKHEYIQALAAETRAETAYFYDAVPSMQELTQQDLFSRPALSVLVGLFGQINWERDREALAAAPRRIVLVEEKLDKRSSAARDVLKDKSIEVKEFNLPHGRELDAWLKRRIQSRGGDIAPKALELLAVRLGRDEAAEVRFGGKVVSVTEAYSLWQADGEISKLLALAGGRAIEEGDVRELVGQNGEVDVFDIVNAAAEGDRRRALELVNNFLADAAAGDEKAKIIQLNALLSEQFRSVALAQHFFSARIPEPAILEKTGWKSGRLFILKKIASKFSAAAIFSLLAKLESLDEELKTGNTPPHVILDLIVAQM